MKKFYYYPCFNKELTTNEAVVLSYIIDWNDRKRLYFSIDYLSFSFGLTKATISNVLKSLVNKGYLKREIPKGKKYYLTKITDKTSNILKEYYSNWLKNIDNHEMAQNEEIVPEEVIEEENDEDIMTLFRRVMKK